MAKSHMAVCFNYFLNMSIFEHRLDISLGSVASNDINDIVKV